LGEEAQASDVDLRVDLRRLRVLMAKDITDIGE
jgi:hypothetical protein